MNRGVILLLGIAAQVALTALFLWRVVPSIADDIANRSERALSSHNINWAQIEVAGRDVTIKGLAPSANKHERALERSARRGGRSSHGRSNDRPGRPRANANQLRTQSEPEPVLRVVDLPAPNPDEVAAQANAGIDLARLGLTYEFRVERQGGDVIMTGMVPDEAVRGVLVDAARERFAEGNVVDNLVVNAAAPADFVSAARQAITIAGLVTSGATGIRGRALYVEGLTASDRDLERLRDTINDALPPGYDAQLQVGSRQSLAAMMRENPDLAARVGPLPGGSADAGRIDLGITRALDRSPEAAARCQARIDDLMSTRAIGFDTGSSDISQDSLDLLDKLVALAKSCPGTRIEIGGHTDDLGTEENNLALSQRRAESVMEYFVKNGIKLGRLSAVGYGESQPRVANRTAADRARNRRIEFRVL